MILVAIITLALAASMDGVTTAVVLKNPNKVEIDPLMTAIYGTSRPSIKEIFLSGAVMITAESLALLGVAHFHPVAGAVFGCLLIAQAIGHVVASIHNLTELKS